MKIIETRGNKPKYDFSGMEVGKYRYFEKTKAGTILNCAKRYSKINNLNWKFRSYTEGKNVGLIRIL